MPIVTISRMYGSGGSLVAERVARRLGWPLLDNALVDGVAQRLGVSREEVSAREERVPTMVERLSDALALGYPELLPSVTQAPLPPSEERILEVTHRVIDEAVAQGPVVLVGRASQAMLAARTDAVHVFCYAPRAALVERIMARHQVDAKEAERIVDETNHQREQYVRKYFHRSWLAHENYHVCLNTAWLGLDGTAELVVRLVREKLAVSS